MVIVGTEIVAGLTGPIQPTVEKCREESQIGLYACVEHVLKRTRLSPNQVMKKLLKIYIILGALYARPILVV